MSEGRAGTGLSADKPSDDGGGDTGDDLSVRSGTQPTERLTGRRSRRPCPIAIEKQPSVLPERQGSGADFDVPATASVELATPTGIKTPQRTTRQRKGDGWRSALSLMSPVSGSPRARTPPASASILPPRRSGTTGSGTWGRLSRRFGSTTSSSAPPAVTPRTREHRRLRERVMAILSRDSSPPAAGKAEEKFTRRGLRVSFDHTPKELGTWGVTAPGAVGCGGPPPGRRSSADVLIGQTVRRVVGMKRSELLDARHCGPLPPPAVGLYLVLLDMDSLLFRSPVAAVDPMPGASLALRQIAEEECEIVLWTAHGADVAARAAIALGTGKETRIVHNFPCWFRESIQRGRVVFQRPALLAAQQAARSDPIEHVVIFDAKMDTPRGFRQNVVLVDSSASDDRWIGPSLVAVVRRIVRQRLSVPDFLFSQRAAGTLTLEQRETEGVVLNRIVRPPQSIVVPVLRPCAAFAECVTSDGRKTSFRLPVRRGSAPGPPMLACRSHISGGQQALAFGVGPDERLLLGSPVPFPGEGV